MPQKEPFLIETYIFIKGFTVFLCISRYIDNAYQQVIVTLLCITSYVLDLISIFFLQKKEERRLKLPQKSCFA